MAFNYKRSDRCIFLFQRFFQILLGKTKENKIKNHTLFWDYLPDRLLIWIEQTLSHWEYHVHGAPISWSYIKQYVESLGDMETYGGVHLCNFIYQFDKEEYRLSTDSVMKIWDWAYKEDLTESPSFSDPRFEKLGTLKPSNDYWKKAAPKGGFIGFKNIRSQNRFKFNFRAYLLMRYYLGPHLEEIGLSYVGEPVKPQMEDGESFITIEGALGFAGKSGIAMKLKDV